MVTHRFIGSIRNFNEQICGAYAISSCRLFVCTTVAILGLLSALVFGACRTNEQSDGSLKRQDLSIIDPKRCKGSGSMNASTPFC